MSISEKAPSLNESLDESRVRRRVAQSVDRGDGSTATVGFVVWLDSPPEAGSEADPLRGVVERMADSERLPFDSIEGLVDVFRGALSRGGAR